MILKRRAMICCLRKSNLNKKTDRLKNGLRWVKILLTVCKESKNSSISFIQGRLQKKIFFRNKQTFFIMIKESILKK